MSGRRAAARRPPLRIVAPRCRPGRRRTPFVIATAMVIGPLVFGVVALQALVSQSSFRMHEIVRQNAQLQQSYGQLKLQVAQLSAPGRIAQQARRLGLLVPDGGSVHTLDVPRTAGGAQQPTMEPAGFALKRLLGDQP